MYAKSVTMKKIIFSFAFLGILTSFLFVACNKENETTRLKIRLTDNPFDAEEVNVDIREVRVNFKDDENGWQTLDTEQGIYNLLGLQNGIDTLLAEGDLPSSHVSEIRFVLGDDNTIKINGEVFPMTVPSGSESGLKLKINKSLHGAVDSILVDFDAALSVHQTGTGEYHLKPVLKIK